MQRGTFASHQNWHILIFFFKFSSHLLQYFSIAISSWLLFAQCLSQIGDLSTLPAPSKLFSSIPCASLSLNSSCNITATLFAWAKDDTALTSATKQTMHHWQYGHHFVIEISSKLIGEWRWWLTSSTQYLTWLWRENGSAYLNVSHSPFTHYHVGWSLISSKTPCVDIIYVT